ncbi:uncharacterized protein ACNLHF_014288 [Anomaloglossus baeobatrachus]
MPISSGAEGHLGVGVDRSIKWVPEGGEDYQAVRISNSYLQRHLNQFGGQEKIKKEEMVIKSQSPQRTHDMQNGVSTKEGSHMYIVEQRRNKPRKVQESPKKETNSTMYSSDNSRKMGKEDLHSDANKHMTSSQESEKSDKTFTNGPVKKSKACVIL